MIALMLAAAVAAQTPGQGLKVSAPQSDLVCLKAAALGRELADAEHKEAFTNLAMFYAGRLSVRDESDATDWMAAATSQATPAVNAEAIKAAILPCADKMKRATHTP